MNDGCRNPRGTEQIRDGYRAMFRHVNRIALLIALGLSATAGVNAEVLELECLLVPFRTIRIGSPVPGTLATVPVERGDVVRSGQVVATLDSRAQQAAVELALARLDYSRRRVERNVELYRNALVSVQQTDDFETEAQLAELELAERLTQVEIRTITSPISGVVVERLKNPGEYVQESEILTLAQIDPLHVEVVVPSSHFGRIAVGQVATVRPEEPVAREIEARVSVMDRVIDAASSTFGMQLVMFNPGLEIPSGLRCRVTIDLGES